MQLKFVSDEIVEQLNHRKSGNRRHNWSEFVEELYKHPNKWAEFPDKVNSSAIAYSQSEKYKDVEVRVTGGNNLSKDHPDKRQWTVYMRFVPKTPAKKQAPKAPNE